MDEEDSGRHAQALADAVSARLLGEQEEEQAQDRSSAQDSGGEGGNEVHLWCHATRASATCAKACTGLAPCYPPAPTRAAHNTHTYTHTQQDTLGGYRSVFERARAGIDVPTLVGA